MSQWHTSSSRKCGLVTLNRNTKAESIAKTRGGFTLVEMLISIALVLLMMVMFAEIFQLASSSIGRMKGLAENDQRSRTLQTVIKADLDKRTFRWVFPFAANENPGAPGSNIANRQGYFYYSENNPNNDLDDSIQFTVMSTLTIRNPDLNPYYGQALNLGAFSSVLNQPDADDAQLTRNDTGLSTVAEVAYFVRNGNLYRRQLLIREPLPISGTNPQPTDGSGHNLFDPTTGFATYSATGPFGNDFDYSAYLTYDSASSKYTGARFVGSNWLDNSTQANNTLGNPAQRFGFSPAGMPGFDGNPIIAGRPKEFRRDSTTLANSASPDLVDYIGRFTLLECSDTNFIYPQNVSSSSIIPVDPLATLTLDPTDSSVTGFNINGARRGEDLILANVHAFDVQIWDESAQSFVSIGDASSIDFALGNRYGAGLGNTPPSPSYGPRMSEDSATGRVNAVFDTWHPRINFTTANDPSPSPSIIGQNGNDDPPFRPLYHRPNTYTTTSDTALWVASTPYGIGDIRFPNGPPGTGQLPYGFPYYYRCVQTLGAGPNYLSGTNEPAWPLVDGMTVVDNNLVWQAVDNRKPLKAIKITIRFQDTTSQQMRQLTIIHSLVD